MGEFFAYAKQKILRCLMAEFLGSFFFVLFGCLAVVTEAHQSAPTGYLSSSLVWGLLVAALYVMIGPTSGCHLNPCITMAFVILKRFPLLEAFLFILAQTAGGVAGAAVLYGLCYPDWSKVGELGVLRVGEGVKWYQAIVMESTLSTFYSMQVFNSFQPDRASNQFQLGATLEISIVYTALTIAAATFSGCALNPIRALGPAIVSQDFKDHYVHWIGPIVGTLVGMGLHALFFKQALTPEETEPNEKGNKDTKTKEADDSELIDSDKDHVNRKLAANQLSRETSPVIVVGAAKEDSLHPSVLGPGQEGDDYVSRVVSFDDDPSEQTIVKADIDALSRNAVVD
ncbi:aquaporin AQPAn.G-like [Convolutriloba macropyga]|uniref:aquaporin AQPAn.G-like n=1 Tax=Convolutriloba macropyga TaxID=536237 RepID=UPI003F525F6F